MPFLEHDGIQFHYEQSGEGRDMVFCHGLTGSLENARELIGGVAGYRQFFWDARGHGRTSPAGPREGFAFDVFARDLAALLDHLQIRDAVVGGISMGAAVSVRFAIRYPDRVRALVLVRPAWLTEPLPEGLNLFPTAGRYMERFGPSEGLSHFERTTAYQNLLHDHPDTALGMREQFLLPDALERKSRIIGIPSDAPIRAWSEVAQVQMPALVFGNAPDYVHPMSYATEWAQRLPRGRFVQVPAKSAGFEPYAASVRAHLTEFLKENP